MPNPNPIKDILKSKNLLPYSIADNIKCYFCQKCHSCEILMIEIIKSLAHKYNQNTSNLSYMYFIPGLGGDDTKELNEFIFEAYINTLMLLDNISINFDNLHIFIENYGLFKILELTENCTYKIIRISPFSNKKQTSLTAVRMEHNTEKISPVNINDIEFQYTKSSGAGGQHINKTMSCVVATHISTGTKVRISQERSQTQNKQIAIRVLSQKLNMMHKAKLSKQSQQEYKNQYKISWGGSFDRIINLHKNKYLKTKYNNKEYNIDSIPNMPLLRIIFDNLIHVI